MAKARAPQLNKLFPTIEQAIVSLMMNAEATVVVLADFGSVTLNRWTGELAWRTASALNGRRTGEIHSIDGVDYAEYRFQPDGDERTLVFLSAGPGQYFVALVAPKPAAENTDDESVPAVTAEYPVAAAD